MESFTSTTRRRLLVAAPPLDDPNFDRTVVFMLEHDDAGAVGVVINRPTRRISAAGIEPWFDFVDPPQVVFTGGPVEPQALIAVAVAHDDEDTVDHVDTVDLSEDARLVGPALRRLRLFCGYSGWGPGQLDHEIAAGAWVVVDAELDDVFGADPNGSWRRVLARQGGRLALLAAAPDDLSMN